MPKIEPPAAPIRNLEAEFLQMVVNLEIKNEAVKAKRAELGPFNFLVRGSTEGLELVSGQTEPAEETYYGFMYYILIVHLNRDAKTHKREYKGVVLYQDGSVLEGHFTNGLLEGEGRKIYANLDYIHGNFTVGKINGKSKHVRADGSYYEGEYVNGMQEGEGYQHFDNGDEYKGGFAKGKYNGYGIRTIKGVHVYEGTFTDGLLNGAGKYYEKGTMKKYEGNFIKGKQHGHGIAVSKMGEKYEGEFENGKKHGKGVSLDAAGNKYEGTWVNDELEGLITYTKVGEAPVDIEFIGGVAKKAGTSSIIPKFTAPA